MNLFEARHLSKRFGGIQAIADLSFEVRQGEFLGVIGPNGAGKTTLLKVISGIFPPQHGEVCVDGRVSPLFELATGFEMEATGWENIRTRALLLGMPSREVDGKIMDIGQFTELGDFLDMPVRSYSSGMFLRLAFAASTAVEPQILLLDEVMAAGDAGFLRKAWQRMDDLIDRAHIVLFVSHSLPTVVRLCPRTVWLDHGEIMQDGPTEEVVHAYEASVRARA